MPAPAAASPRGASPAAHRRGAVAAAGDPVPAARRRRRPASTSCQARCRGSRPASRGEEGQLAIAQRVFDAAKAQGWPAMLSFSLQGNIAVYP
jgi:hypothetical protein